jgi:hypothetical protein
MHNTTTPRHHQSPSNNEQLTILMQRRSSFLHGGSSFRIAIENVLKRCPRVRIPPKTAFPWGKANTHSSKPPMPFFSTVISVLLSWSYPAINQSTVPFVSSWTSLQAILSNEVSYRHASFVAIAIASLIFGNNGQYIDSTVSFDTSGPKICL